jgi:AcrR family transcriptional regulator
VAATLPLLLEHGPAVTTRQIAEAAGVAEGTVFRVFPDKESLLEAVVESAFDMTAIDAALAAIDPAQPLEDRLPQRRHHRQRRRHRGHRLHLPNRSGDARRRPGPDRLHHHRRLLRRPHGHGVRA